MPIRRKNLVRSISLLLLFVVFLAACKKTALYHNLAEKDANEIIVVLYGSGIDASKVREMIQNEISWNVVVKEKDLPESRRLLVERNLPRKRAPDLASVYKDKGLIPTPDEQKARFLLAVKGEIVNSLESIPEVIDADVVINVPTPEEFATGDKKRPTASVVLKVKPERHGVSQLTESKVQQYVAHSIEDLNPRDVSVIISYVTPPADGEKPGDKLILPKPPDRIKVPVAGGEPTVTVAGITVAKKSAKRLKIYLSIFFALLVIISAVLIVNVVRTTRMRQEYKALAQGGESPLLEGEVEEPMPQLEAGEEEE